ncbi:hypothetical protein Tco_0110638 [Tanacetum coccineum]
MMRVTTAFLRGEVTASNQTNRRANKGWKDVARNQGAQARQPKGSAKSSKEEINIQRGLASGNLDGSTMAKGCQTKDYAKLLYGYRSLMEDRPHKYYMNIASADSARRDAEHSTSTWMNFVVVRSPSPYNGIIGKPGVRKIQAVPSTAHEMLKFPIPGGILTLRSSGIIPLKCTTVSRPEAQPSDVVRVAEERIKVAIHPEYPKQTIAIGSTLTEEGRKELCDLLRRNLDIFAWKQAEMTIVPRHVAKHQLNVREGCPLVRQKKRSQAPKMNKAIQEEVEKLVDDDILKEVDVFQKL